MPEPISLSLLAWAGVGAFTASSVTYAGVSVIREGRQIEQRILEFKTEEIIYKGYRDQLFALELPSNLRETEDMWHNASIRTYLETHLGNEKAHHLIRILVEISEKISQLRAVFLHFDLLDNPRNPSSGFDEVDLFAELTFAITELNGHRRFLLVDKILSRHINNLRRKNKDIQRVLASHYRVLPLLTEDGEPLSQNRWPFARIRWNTTAPKVVKEDVDRDGDLDPEHRKLILPNPTTGFSPRRSAWKILMASKHKRFFLLQALVFGVAVPPALFWSIMKHDIGTGTGIGGFIFSVGSMINMTYDKCYSASQSTQELDTRKNLTSQEGRELARVA